MAQKKKTGKPSGSKKQTKRAKIPEEVQQETIVHAPVRRSVLDEICAILLLAGGAFLVVAFQTNAAGALGMALSDGFKGCFGMIAFMIPYYLIIYGILLFFKKTVPVSGKSGLLAILILLMCALINSARYIDPANLQFGLGSVAHYFGTGIHLESGGLFGMYIGSIVVKAVGIPGIYIFSVVVILICLLLVINTPFSQFFERAAERRQRRREREALDEMQSEEELFEELTIPEPKKQKKKRRPLFSDTMDYTSANFQDEEPEDYSCHIEQKSVPFKNTGISEYRESHEDKPYREETSYIPGKISAGQQNILDYMKSDMLYGISAQEDANQVIFEEEEEDFSAADYELGEYGFRSEPPEEETESFFSRYNKEKEAEREDVEAAAEETMEDAEVETVPAQAGEPARMTNAEAAGAVLSQQEINTVVPPAEQYQLPPLDLLRKAKGAERKLGVDHTLQNKAMKLEQTLQNFHIDAKVIQVTQGPAITRYEIQPNVGVKVKSIVNLADDIALNMEAKSIRIEAPIPGKAAVGIEVENDKVNMVTLREIVDTEEFRKSESRITFAVGKDIAGKAVTADLKAMPHLLIAGSTGSGKSVCVNSIITSILYKARPDEVKLVLIDPKVVELANYNGIPHLLIPVVTEPSKAAAALNWAVAEMDDRYKKFAAEGVRDLKSYNNTVKKRGEDDLFLPQVVIIIDELADLMMAAPSQVEESICRLAQKARAAGMHLIVATQRPSVDIITGVIKANIPSRIAFAVSSQFDSRTILDMAGAEKLVGKGDMLFNPIGSGKPQRVQGTFVSDEEVHDVIEFVKGQVEETKYSHDVIHTIERANTPNRNEDGDELLADAIETVVLAGSASVSMLQRRFRVGYNRAARMIDMMEERGIVGPPEGSKPRQVLMTEAELHELQQETEGVEEA